MQPSDLGALIDVAQPTVSPDGTTVAFVVQRADLDDNTYRSQVWLAAVDGSSAPLPFTSGDHKDANPTWSPDGGRLAFTSTRGEGEQAKSSMHVAPVRTGGEVVTLAKLPEGAGGLQWSPDGRQIAFTTRTRDERLSDDDERKQPPRRITRLFARLDNEGFVVDRPQHVYVIPADGSAPPRNLTPGEHQLGGPVWTPDSSTLIVSGATHDTWDLDRVVDLHAIDVGSGERTRITGTSGDYDSPSVSPDGTRVAFLGTDDPTSYPHNRHIGVVEVRGGEHRWVSDRLDRTFAPFPGARRPHWVDAETLLVSVEDRGNVHLYRVAADGSTAPEPVWSEDGCATGYDAAAGTIAFTLSTPTRPGELCVLDDGTARPLTDLTAAFATQAQLRPYEQFTVPSADGTVELDAWLVTPPDFDPSASYPMLVNVHGGPFTQYANRFFDEFQIQAREGYVVLLCNPRGSSGRAESFGRAICGAPLGGTGWGSVDYDDVMAVVDHAVKTHAFVDAERLGILGGSYGGYMTSWAVGHTDRFKAACSERACNNLLSQEWSSDAAGAFHTWFGVGHLDGPELWLSMSPITYVREIDTPLLILHAEDDLRCSIEQAEQLFVALRLAEKDVELVRFPAEGHEMSRSGSPVHRRQRAELILEFFGRHLKPQAAGHHQP
ncbi:MAG: prolyl oligopeptidase family serine peptidase [Propionibacteriales bacterium]|nr:prolyl oligopeptidase family serine peptidase [Propionibacteriales bacterium]